MRLFTLALAAVAAPAVVSAQPHAQGSDSAACGPGRTPLVIVGTYHMANPGKDAVNLNADDVLSDRRQREIDVLVRSLARFRPTKIAIEAPFTDTTMPARYRAYRAGRYALTRSEIDQVAFRLADRLGLPTVYPVDYPMYMSGLTPAEIMLPAPAPDAPPSGAAGPAPLTPEDSLLRALSVTAYYRHLNSDSVVRANHREYLEMLLPDTTTPALYAHADLIANWYKRNLRIFANLNRIAVPGQDRVLLLIGAGHLTILEQLADAAPYYCRVDVRALLAG